MQACAIETVGTEARLLDLPGGGSNCPITSGADIAASHPAPEIRPKFRFWPSEPRPHAGADGSGNAPRDEHRDHVGHV